jgi:hypothetical protein
LYSLGGGARLRSYDLFIDPCQNEDMELAQRIFPLGSRKLQTTRLQGLLQSIEDAEIIEWLKTLL